MEETRLEAASRSLRCQHCGQTIGWHTLHRVRINMDATRGIEMGHGTLFIQCHCGRWCLWQSEERILKEAR